MSLLVPVQRGQDLKEKAKQLRVGCLCFAKYVQQTLLAAQL